MPSPAPAGAGIVRLARRNFAYVSAFLMDICLGAGTIAFTYIAKKEPLNAGPAHLGGMALVAAGVYVVSSLVFGKLSDRWGRRCSIAVACLVGSAAFGLGAAVTKLWHIYALMAVSAAAMGAFWPALEADISDHSTPAELPRRIGRFNVAWCSGFAIAGLAAGHLGEHVNQRAVLLATAGAGLLNLVVYLLRTFEPESFPAREPDERAVHRAATRAGTFWKMALILNFAAMGLNAALRYHVPSVTGGERSALGGTYLALIFAAETLTFLVLGRWHGWHYRSAPLAAAWALLVAGGLLCGLTPMKLLFGAGCVLIGVGCGVIYNSSIYYSVSAETGRGHRGGVHESALGLGAAVIPYLGGVLMAVPWAGGLLAWPDGTPFLTAVAVLLAACAVSALVYMRIRKTPATPPPERR